MAEVKITYSNDFKNRYPTVVLKDPTPQDSAFADKELQSLSVMELGVLVVDHYTHNPKSPLAAQKILSAAGVKAEAVCPTLWFDDADRKIAPRLCGKTKFTYPLQYELEVSPRLGDPSQIAEHFRYILKFVEDKLPAGEASLFLKSADWKMPLKDGRIKIKIVPAGEFREEAAMATTVAEIDAEGKLEVSVLVRIGPGVKAVDLSRTLDRATTLYHEIYGNVSHLLSGKHAWNDKDRRNRAKKEISVFTKSLAFARHLEERIKAMPESKPQAAQLKERMLGEIRKIIAFEEFSLKAAQASLSRTRSE